MKHINEFKLNESDKPSIEILPAILSALNDIEQMSPECDFIVNYVTELVKLLHQGKKYYDSDDTEAWESGQKNYPGEDDGPRKNIGWGN